MSSQSLDHEEAILLQIEEGGNVTLERALLILSGLRSDGEFQSFGRKIDDIFARFVSGCASGSLAFESKPPPYLHETIAKRLFEYLWNAKPKRFGDHFLLTDVVDAQLDSDVNRSVGTCVGLTSLYSVLGLRMGLHLSLLVSSDHLKNRLWVGERAVDMDHTDPQGFDCPGGDGFRELSLLTLTANVLNSRGLRHERTGRFAAAKADYQKSVLVNPEYANAYNNRGNMYFRDGDLQAAIKDYTEAIRLDSSFFEAYCNRGMARQKLGFYDEARQDYNRAVSVNPNYADAHRCLHLLDILKHEGHQQKDLHGM